MLPTVFLSLSGTEARFVERVHELLPDGIAQFYVKSFANGENLITAMEQRVQNALIFVLFASKASAKSDWVRFEIDRARLNLIQRPGFRLLVFPLDREVAHADLPSWVREHWIEQAGRSPRDVARYIRRVVEISALSGLKTAQVLGRGALLDSMFIDFQDASLTTHETPNVLVFGGNDGIGRRTLCAEFLTKAYPALPNLNAGPVFELPQFSDLADIYRALRQEIEQDFSSLRFRADLDTFRHLSLDGQTEEVVASLSRFGDLRQSVTLVTGNGIFEDRGFLKPWVPSLFGGLAPQRDVKLFIISNRLVHNRELRQHPNVLQFSVPALTDAHVRSLMIAVAEDRGKELQLPKRAVISAIGGHPQIAKAAARLVIDQGAAVLDDDPRELFALQEEILARCLDFANLSAIEKDVLSILSWVPHLNSKPLRACLVERHGITPEDFAETLATLQRGCLIQVGGPNYQIASPMRGLFRRKHGYGSTDLRQSFAATIKEEWRRASEEDRVPTELVDAILFMAALEGGTFPPEFRDLLLPSTLQELVRDAYYRRDADGASALGQVIQWGSLAETMTMDETTREEILSFVSRAQTRLGDKVSAEETLRFIDEHSYRSRFYLRAFYMRRIGGDLRGAVRLLLEARKVGKYKRSVLADLGLCYYKLGEVDNLRKLFEDEAAFLDGNPALLDIQAAIYIGSGKYPEAVQVIRRMRSSSDDDGRGDCREAQIMMLRDQNFSGAQQLLTDVLQRGQRGGAVATRRMRAFAAASAGDEAVARGDAEWLAGQLGGTDTVHYIESRILLKKGRYNEALAEVDKVTSRSRQDTLQIRQDALLRARIKEAQASDPSTPLAMRPKLRGEVAVLRRQYGGISEFQEG